MVIFAFHMPIFFYSQTFIRPFFKSQLYYKPIEFVLIWGICLVLIPLFNWYALILIGKSITDSEILSVMLKNKHFR